MEIQDCGLAFARVCLASVGFGRPAQWRQPFLMRTGPRSRDLARDGRESLSLSRTRPHRALVDEFWGYPATCISLSRGLKGLFLRPRIGTSGWPHRNGTDRNGSEQIGSDRKLNLGLYQ